MKAGIILRIISAVMLIAAVIFVAVALTHPELGTAFYIGTLKVGAEIFRIFYAIYLLVMTGLFVLSFLISRRKQQGHFER